jgi:hypothetical protein
MPAMTFLDLMNAAERGTHPFWAPPAVFLQASDSTNQQPSATTPVQVTLNTLDGQSGDFVLAATGDITFLRAGIYLIIFGGQVGETSNAHLVVNLWLRKNGADIPNTNVSNSVTLTTDTKVVVANCVAAFRDGDVLKIMMSCDTLSKGGGLIASSPVGEAKIPSIMVSVARVGD